MSAISIKKLELKLLCASGLKKISVANELHEEKLKNYSLYLYEIDNNKNFKNFITITEFCRMLSLKDIFVGRNNMYKFLRKKGIIMKNNIPYEKYQKRDYFRIKRHICAGKIHFQLFLTVKGASFLLKKYFL